MEKQELKGTIRDTRKKGASRRLREAGKIPAVCYGKGLETLSLTLDPVELQKVVSGPYMGNAIFDLKVEGGESRQVMVQSIQRDPVTRRYLHADLIVVSDDEKLLVEVPISLTGRSVGVAMGGKLRQVARSVKVRCLPKDIPVSVEFDVTPMGVGERAQVSQIKPAEGLELVYLNDFAIAQVSKPRS